MSKGFIMSAGSSTSKNLPAIYVEYPEGAICTITNGIKTYKAKDNSGSWLLTGISFGTWTVTALADNEVGSPASETVEISEDSPFASIVLSFGFSLVKNGVILVESGAASSAGGATITEYDGYTELYKQGSGYHFWWFAIPDIGPYNTIAFEIRNLSPGAGVRYGVVNSGVTITGSNTSSFNASGTIGKNTPEYDVYTLDISALSGAKRAAFHASGATTHQLNIKNIRLY